MEYMNIYDRWKHTKDWDYKETENCGGYDQGFYDEWFNHAEEHIKYLEYLELAKKQVFIAEVKKEIIQEKPKEYEVHKVALTISPEERSTPNVCKQIVEIMKGLTCVSKMHYVYEQTAKEGDGDGWHLHFDIETSYAPSKVKQFAQQKISRKGINAMYIAKLADNRWLDNYMAGLKFNGEKEAGVVQTQVLRKKLGLEEIYSFQKV